MTSLLQAKHQQQGAILLLSLVFLLLLAIVASTVARTSTLQLQMAGNEQFRQAASQKAQAVVSALIESEANFPLYGDIGHSLCDSASVCDENTLAVAMSTEAVPDGVALHYQVQRKGPLLLDSLPYRAAEQSAISSRHFDLALFEVSAEVDGRSVRQGHARVVEGIARRVSAQ